ncbi:protein-tyrosine phosphatase family protein [Desulfobulbus elongatus]|uniref:protein-tyrosine phosphatase family protein n=1 Tax=Desulfobulbus elongatus TaxID=53332 RepID=UPI00054D047E|nr:dual specificity protein phosphatase family protein [Desulfobulbus elongatus]
MYQLHWITDHLATGHAPMSYEDLAAIRAQGIRAIVNLCGEFCDLHQIEESSGFEVYYLPVADECAPDLAAMEKALDWLDESIYLDKKVLVHCRMGHGRTGTFIAAYLLRRGFAFREAEQTMKGKHANPATFAQRRFLKEYGRQAGPLRTVPPRIDNRPRPDVAPLLAAYAQAIAWADARIGERHAGCGLNDHPCCHSPFDLRLIESMHLSQAINRGLTQGQRQEVIERALALARTMKELHHQQPGLTTDALAAHFPQAPLACPLLADGQCLVFADRPPRCRYGHGADDDQAAAIAAVMAELSRQAYQTLTGRTPPAMELTFSSADTISGKFVQLYFQAASGKTE